MRSWQRWRTAMHTALYGEAGFFRCHRPADHFRTSPHVSEIFAGALLRLADSAELTCVIDIGAGGGELLAALARMRPGLRLVGVEIAERPPELPDRISWWHRLPDRRFESALLVANEWLDNVPLDVAVPDADGRPRLLEVRTGESSGRASASSFPSERPGRSPDPDQLAWLDRWWPVGGDVPRAEIGLERDRAWASAIGMLDSGLALAIDYGHVADDRPDGGTLTGWRDGRPTAPFPDGRRDITAHVAIDAVREAGERAGARTESLNTQREALHDLGISAPRPPFAMAQRAPLEYLARLGRTSAVTELSDPAGLGSYHWLLQSIDRQKSDL